ncbi:MAG: BTAD domain-containing putative transcriptional regulator [Pseudomonadota bacterium]
MASVARPLAKLTPPRVKNAVDCARLSLLLDEAAEQTLIWIGSPAGSGKTTLIAKHYAARKQPLVWCQMDEGDADPATFFFYLAAAARQRFPRRRFELPDLTPEYLAGIPTFTRNFFRSLFSALPERAIVVLDNFQLASVNPIIEQILAVAVAETPHGNNLVVASREQPGGALAPLTASGDLAQLTWEDMQRSASELKEIAKASKLQIKESDLGSLGGWVAGVPLLGEISDNPDFEHAAGETWTRERVFEYFAAEIYDHQPKALRRFLVQNAVWPRIYPALAQTLTGEPNAKDILARLTRRNFFTTRTATEPLVFEFHPLFRAFLQSRAQQDLDEDERKSTYAQAAALLSDNGEFEPAIGLWIEAQQWAKVGELIAVHGQELLAQGRQQRLLQWFELLPDEIAALPAFQLWRGIALLALNPMAGRQSLELAYEGFEAQADVRSSYLALTGILESIWMTWDFNSVQAWRGRFEDFRSDHPVVCTPELEVLAVTGVLGSQAVYFSGPEELAYWTKVGHAMLASPLPDSRKVVVAAIVGYLQITVGDYLGATATIESMEDLAGSASATPFAEIFALAIRHEYLFWFGDSLDGYQEIADDIWELSRSTGILVLDNVVTSCGTYTFFAKSDIEGATPYIARLQDAGIPHGSFDRSHYYFQLAWFDWLKGNHAGARALIDQAEESLSSSLSSIASTYIAIGRANISIATGDLAHALRAAAHAKAQARQFGFHKMIVMVRYLSAHIALLRGQPERARRLLAAALAQAANLHLRRTMFHDTAMMATLMHFALKQGIETNYARELVKVLELKPPGAVDNPEHWPFALEIRCLGEFKILREGKPLQYGQKAPKRSLQLLKAIIARGGSNVPLERLVADIWEGYDADAAMRAYRTALHRLRKLIGEESLTSGEHGVTLNPERCWIDAYCFETLSGHAKPTEPEQIASAIEIYRGHFLELEEATPWSLTFRERLRTKVIALINRAGSAFEAQDEWKKALDVYHSGIALDPLAEPFYQGAMQAYLTLDEKSEAAKTYRTCERVLAQSFAIEPSEKTKALFQQTF